VRNTWRSSGLVLILQVDERAGVGQHLETAAGDASLPDRGDGQTSRRPIPGSIVVMTYPGVAGGACLNGLTRGS
jgi:hypothetical protein